MPSLSLSVVVCDLISFFWFRIVLHILPLDPTLPQFSYAPVASEIVHTTAFFGFEIEHSGHEKERAGNDDRLLKRDIN